MLTVLKVIGALLAAAACAITYLALSEEYELANAQEPTQGRVISIEDDVVRYERYIPNSPWDDDGDGWVGPYSEDGVPANALRTLTQGSALELRDGELELARSAPTKWLWGGFALSLLLALFWGFQPMIARRQLQKVQGDAIEVIKLMLRRSRRTSLAIALIMLTIGAGIGGVALAAGGKAWEIAFLVGLGAIAALAAVPFLRTVWHLRRVERAPVLRAIIDEPERIVWIYEQVVTVNGIAQHNLFLGFRDGERFDFHLGETPTAPLIEALRKRLPHAVVGYDPHLEAQWKKAPGEFLMSVRG